MGSISRKIQKSKNESTIRRIKTAGQAYQEGLAEGFKKGHMAGYQTGSEAVQTLVDEALVVLFTKIATLDQIPDIGKKRFRKILDHFDIASKEELVDKLKGS